MENLWKHVSLISVGSFWSLWSNSIWFLSGTLPNKKEAGWLHLHIYLNVRRRPCICEPLFISQSHIFVSVLLAGMRVTIPSPTWVPEFPLLFMLPKFISCLESSLFPRKTNTAFGDFQSSPCLYHVFFLSWIWSKILKYDGSCE